eukprot:gene4300-20500_t
MSGSEYFNYKGYFSIVLLALASYDYKLIFVDVGASGRNGDAGLFETSPLNQQMKGKSIAFPEAEQFGETCIKSPHNPHAFKTLSVIYDEKGDAEKALQYALISAFLGSRDPHEWRDLAIRCLQSGSRKQALICYNNGCKVARHNVVLQWERAALIFEEGDFKRALECYNTILKILTFVDGAKMIEFGKEMAQIHHFADNAEKAIEILELMFAKYPDYVDFEGINMLAELHISAKNFERSLQVVCKHAGVKIPASILSASDKTEESFAENVEETSDVKLPPKMIESINSLLETKQIESTNVEFTTQFAKSLVQETQPVRENPDLSTVPPSWTEFLLSPSKNAQAEEEGRQTELVDLDKVSKEVMKEKMADKADVSAKRDNDQWNIPDHVPIDIRVKIAVSAIELKVCFDVQRVLCPLFKESLEDVGDLYLDVSEAYINVGRCEDAIWYLEELIASEKYCKAAVWLKLAECRHAVGKLSEAADAYYKVLELAPNQLGVTLELANLCRRLGRTEEARSILAGSSTDETMDENSSQCIVEITKKDDFKLWYQKCLLLHGQGQTESLAENGYIFFVNYFKSAAISREDGLSKAFVWELLLKVIKAMVSLEQYSKACEIIDKSASFRSFSENKRYRCELDFLSATTNFLARDYLKAFDAFRWALLRSEKRGLNSTAMWNFFSRITNNMPDRKGHKYVLRQLFKHPAILPLIIVNGHNTFLCGSYKYALGEYIRAFRMKPRDPMLSLCIGITYLHLACQRFTKHRHTSVLQRASLQPSRTSKGLYAKWCHKYFLALMRMGIAFMLQYYNMRGRCQEACYNLARAFHQVGLVHFSVMFYNKALNFPLKEDQYSEFSDLHREAAYNLALIYKNSGNDDLARRTLCKYIWV